MQDTSSLINVGIVTCMCNVGIVTHIIMIKRIECLVKIVTYTCTHSYPLIAHYDEVYLLPGAWFKMPIVKVHIKKS